MRRRFAVFPSASIRDRVPDVEIEAVPMRVPDKFVRKTLRATDLYHAEVPSIPDANGLASGNKLDREVLRAPSSVKPIRGIESGRSDSAIRYDNGKLATSSELLRRPDSILLEGEGDRICDPS